jgi:hypothetical protein
MRCHLRLLTLFFATQQEGAPWRIRGIAHAEQLPKSLMVVWRQSFRCLEPVLHKFHLGTASQALGEMGVDVLTGRFAPLSFSVVMQLCRRERDLHSLGFCLNVKSQLEVV